MNKKNILIAIIVLALIVLGVILNNNEKNRDVLENEKNESLQEINFQIIVDVKGEVKVPGLYCLNSNSRVIDAINIAGGTTSLADLEKINLATKLEDGMIVNIFKQEASYNKNRISINNGTLDELMKLPGIGEAKAKSIIDYRIKNGYFMSLEQIIAVDGINENLYKQIKELICL